MCNLEALKGDWNSTQLRLVFTQQLQMPNSQIIKKEKTAVDQIP